MTTIQHGLIIPEIVENKDYVFGGYGAIDGEILQPNGQWDDYLPVEEDQNLNGIEPSACATFGTLNAVETLKRRLYGEEYNYSDRYLAKTSGTLPGIGNDPHRVAETLRKKGDVKESVWPFDSSIDSATKFYGPVPSKLEVLALTFLMEFGFKHEYVPSNPDSLKNALKYSPLGFSVYAWVQDDGLYYRPEGMRDTHWVMCYGYVDKQYWKIFDSYDNNTKMVKWDALPMVAKRYWLTKQPIEETFLQKVLRLINHYVLGRA